MSNEIRAIIAELVTQAEYERTKDLGGSWTEEYREGYADGLERACELILEEHDDQEDTDGFKLSPSERADQIAQEVELA